MLLRFVGYRVRGQDITYAFVLCDIHYVVPFRLDGIIRIYFSTINLTIKCSNMFFCSMTDTLSSPWDALFTWKNVILLQGLQRGMIAIGHVTLATFGRGN